MASRQVKVFRVSVDDAPEPIPFAIEFTHRKSGETVTRDFVAVGEPPPGAQLALASLVRIDEHGRQQVDLNGILAFFQRVLSATEFNRFTAALDDVDLVVPLDTVTAIMNWLLEEYAGRPFMPSSPSSPSPPTDGPASTAPPVSTESISGS